MTNRLRFLMAAPIAVAAIAMTTVTFDAADAAAKYKQCKGNHVHWSKEMTAGTKKAAYAKAIQDWASFTGFEYGNKWIDFRIAKNQKVNCEKSGPSSWTCVANATPCRLTNRVQAALR